MKALIVDDEKIICDGLCAMIEWENFGFQLPDTAFNGTQALKKMEDTQYNVLITDIRMPAMDGLSLCQSVHTLYPDCAIIILSGYGDFQYAQRAIDFGVRRYLLKPVDENKLKEVLTQIQQEHQKKQIALLHEIDAKFYEVNLPFTKNTCEIITSVSEAGKLMARCLVKGDMSTVTSIIRGFAFKLYSTKPPRDIRIELCETFLSHTINVAKNLKIKELYSMDVGSGYFQLYNAETLADLYCKITTLVISLNDHLQARTLEEAVRISDQMVFYIQENYQQKLSAASLARHFHLSAAYCGRVFKEEQGISIIQYIHKVRIEQAKRLLTKNDDKIEYIALQVGYPEISSFYSRFKMLVDMTPEQYRRLSRKQEKGTE